MKRYTILIFILVLIFISGCASSKKEPTSLSDKYPKKLEQVNKILLINGSTGAKKEITDQNKITAWIQDVKDIVLYPDENQEERDGFMYDMLFYKDEKLLFSFGLTYLDKTFYYANDDMLKLTEQLFNSN